ncbi:MAG: glutamate synthase subunit beta [Bacteroidales bacterium]|nr:glutamate synthase subunit beta [Bacteroidales bacterium]
MGDPKAFLTVPRQEAGHRPVHERICDFSEVEQVLNESERRRQASRCMDCGVPFCHWACPLGNRPPEWQDAIYRNEWEYAFRLLSQTNDFPEFTGRVCPALCEKSCVLNHTISEPVTTRENECAVIEKAFAEGYIKPCIYSRNGKKVSVVGAGPSGLSAAVRLNCLGYEVSVFDKMQKAGGLVRYGIPNFKLDKFIIDRRIKFMEDEGIHFICDTFITPGTVPEGFDACVIATGTPVARDLSIPGRELKGIYFALQMLTQQNEILEGREFPSEELVNAKGKRVLVIGGGDTGSDCIGTCHRHGALAVTQIEIMPKPPEGENPATPWPYWPQVLRTSTSHEEGCVRRWCLASNRFLDDGRGNVAGVEVERVEWIPAADGRRPVMKATGEKEIIECDLVLLAMGFLKPQHPEYPENVFLCGDAKNGASLVVRAIASGRETAKAVDSYLNPENYGKND